MKVIVAVVLAVLLLVLVRRRYLQIDLSFPLFLSLAIVGLASTNEVFIDGLAGFFGIAYQPLAVILLALFIVVSLVTTVAIGVSRLRNRQLNIVRRLVSRDLDGQESRLRDSLGVTGIREGQDE